MMGVIQKQQQLKSKPFIALEPRVGIVKFVSIFEVSKIVINKERLEITVLYSNGDKDIVKFRSLEGLEDALKRIYSVYASVFLKP